MHSISIAGQVYSIQNCFIIAEVAQGHDGSLGFAHAFIDAVARTGANAIKFQTHIAHAESSDLENWRVKFSLQDASRYDYWKRMEFTQEQWAGLKQHCNERGLTFLSSPFSLEAIDLLERVGMPVWKIASGEVSNPILLDRIIKTGKPILLSSGMSSIQEMDRTIVYIKSANIPFAVLQCTSAYPCPPEKWGLGVIPLFRQRYDCPVGLSDHSGTIYSGLAAAAIGIDVLEAHITLSRDMFGPDVPASITTEEFTTMVNGIRQIQTSINTPFDKDQFSKDSESLRNLFTKSLVAKVDIPQGSLLCEENLTDRKPGTGIPATKLKDLIGRTVKRTLRAGEFIAYKDLE